MVDKRFKQKIYQPYYLKLENRWVIGFHGELSLEECQAKVDELNLQILESATWSLTDPAPEEITGPTTEGEDK